MPLKDSPSKSKTKTKTAGKSGSGTVKGINITSTTPKDPASAVAAAANQQGQDEQQQQEEGEPKKPVKKKRPLQPVELVLGEVLVNADGETTSPKRFVVENGVIGLYFAAHWCPPCKTLSPDLMLLHEEVRKAGHRFEMIYVSSDVQGESFKEYLSKMPWWAVPYENEELRENLAVKFNVSGIPLFVLLDANTLEVITRHGRLFVMVDPRGDKFPWKDLPLPVIASKSNKDKQPGAAAAVRENKVATPGAERESRENNIPEGDDTLKPKDSNTPGDNIREEATSQSEQNRPTTSQDGQNIDDTAPSDPPNTETAQ